MKYVRSALSYLRYSTIAHMGGFFVIANITYVFDNLYYIMAILDWLLLLFLTGTILRVSKQRLPVITAFTVFSLVSLPQRLLLLPVLSGDRLYLGDIGHTMYFAIAGLSAIGFGAYLVTIINALEQQFSFYNDVDIMFAILFVIAGLGLLVLMLSPIGELLGAIVVEQTVLVIKFFVLPSLGIYQYQLLLERLQDREYESIDLYPS